MMLRFVVGCLLVIFAGPSAVFAETASSDLLVYGATPAGIMGAIAAARAKCSVTLIEPTRWIGGMTTGGLSSSDTGNIETIGGLALEFFNRCGASYGGKEKFHCEPHVYQKVF